MARVLAPPARAHTPTPSPPPRPQPPAPGAYPPAAYALAPNGPVAAHATDPSLRGFWEEQAREVDAVGTDPAQFKNHQLPLARIKKVGRREGWWNGVREGRRRRARPRRSPLSGRPDPTPPSPPPFQIMKSDEDVRMISAEAPVLFARACEMFILELTLRAWAHADENKRRTLQRNDVAAAITRTDIFDFLVDIVPREALAAPGDGAPPPYWPPGVPPPAGVDALAAGQGVDPAMLQYWQAQAASGGAAGWQQAPPGGDGPPPQ